MINELEYAPSPHAPHRSARPSRTPALGSLGIVGEACTHRRLDACTHRRLDRAGFLVRLDGLPCPPTPHLEQRVVAIERCTIGRRARLLGTTHLVRSAIDRRAVVRLASRLRTRARRRDRSKEVAGVGASSTSIDSHPAGTWFAGSIRTTDSAVSDSRYANSFSIDCAHPTRTHARAAGERHGPIGRERGAASAGVTTPTTRQLVDEVDVRVAACAVRRTHAARWVDRADGEAGGRTIGRKPSRIGRIGLIGSDC